MRISVRISSAASAVANSPVKKRSIGIVRSPSGPWATTIARSASIVAGWSLAGSPCARFPPTVARLRTRGSAMTRAVSSRMGKRVRTISDRSSAASRVRPPMRK